MRKASLPGCFSSSEPRASSPVTAPSTGMYTVCQDWVKNGRYTQGGRVVYPGWDGGIYPGWDGGIYTRVASHPALYTRGASHPALYTRGAHNCP